MVSEKSRSIIRSKKLHHSPPLTPPPSNVEFLAGITAGLVTAALFHPIDTLKIKFQVHEGKTGFTAHGPYHSSLTLTRHILQTQGLPGLYRGLVVGTLASGASWGVYFELYEGLKPFFARHLVGGTSPLSHGVSGVAAGCVTVVLMNPMWLIKVRMQVDEGSNGNPSAWRTLRAILKQDGPTGLMRGVVPALILTSNGAIQIAAYEELKRLVRTRGGLANETLDPLLMGAASKVVSTLCTYPFQVAKTRMQQGLGAKGYESTWGSVRKIYLGEGLKGFYKGFGANLVRVVPNSAVVFAVYEATKTRLNFVSGLDEE